jgi:Gas vesicle protein
MPLEKIPLEHRMLELMDRVLDKGVVIDTASRVAVGGIALMDMDTRVIVASFQTYVRHVDAHEADVRAALRRAMEVGRTSMASEVLETKVEATTPPPAQQQGPREEPPGRSTKQG